MRQSKKIETKKLQKPDTVEKLSFRFIFLPILLAILLAVNPLFPDVQISRPKLLVLELGVFVLLFCWAIQKIFSDEIRVCKTSLNLPILAYIVYIFIAYLLSTNKSVAISEFKRMILCSAIFFLTVNILAQQNIRSLNSALYERELGGGLKRNFVARNIILIGFVIGSSIAAIYGLLQHWGTIKIFRWVISVPQFGRVMSTFGNPIFFAAHLVIFIPVVLSLVFYVITMEKKSGLLIHTVKILLLLAILLVSILALYFTKTRAAWIGAAVSIVVFSILNLKSKKAKVIFILAGAILYFIFVAITWQVWMRHQAHPVIWRDTLNMWLHYPIFGTGPGTFHINFPKFASEELLRIWPQKANIINDAHNEYIQILSETGIIGLGIFIWILVSFFRYGLKLHRELDKRNSYIVAGLISSVVAIIVQNLFSVDMRFIISAFYMFLVMGILYSYNTEFYQYSLKLNRAIKIPLAIVTIFVFGVIGFDPSPAVHIGSMIHLNFATKKIVFGPDSLGTGLLPQVLKPYIAQKKLSQEVDFFDEKVLEPYKTIAELEELSKKFPNEAKIYERLAWIYAKERNFLKAIENYEKSIELNPNVPGPFNNLGNIFFLMGNRPRAIEFYKKSLEINPQQIDARINLGLAYYHEGMLKEASEEFNRVLQLDPSNEKAIVALKRMRE